MSAPTLLASPRSDDDASSSFTFGPLDSFRSANEISEAIAETLANVSGGGPKVIFRDMGSDPALGREILKAEEPRADLVVAVGAEAAVLARDLVTTHPVLFCGVSNPIRYGLAAPNVAGLSREASTEFQLTALKRLLPTRSRVGIIYQPDRSAAFVQSALALAHDLGLVIEPAPVRGREDIDPMFRMIRNRIDVLWLVPDSLVDTDLGFDYIATRGMENGIPIVAFAESFASKGALLAMYSTPRDIGDECAAIAVSLLRNETTPEDFGIRGPQNVRLKTNRYVADTLGIRLPSPR